jgi:hypothetical protein
VFSCKKETTELSFERIQNYYPISKGKYITYRLDSTVYTTLGTKKEVRSYIVIDVLDTSITDNLGKIAYVFKRSIRNSIDTTQWDLLTTYRVSIDSAKIAVTENNLRFIKLVSPLREGLTWKGNSFVNSNDNNNLVFLDGWLYSYGKPNVRQTINGNPFIETVSVFQKNDTIGNPNDKKMYAEILFSKEVYAKNIGLVYKEFIHETWQPPNANLVNGYYEEGSYGIKLSLIKHNF